ncbi:PREDICTED: putative nuclease HARBI1 [Rhagoletis zephyria]|uniref:putative nuclease HARBI1 n=1 Tax=Rhagoletis zephyria TaxID=28612 RepID=UPI0008115770|nr:PREDICTED: putative nuclease HARBI1 [Rhagoletis zephyria]XP_017481242.1 PREDICTED: putative nuclease HARBI1 [Rhagoletis zephyria]
MAFEYLAYVLSRDEEVENPSAVEQRLLRDVDNPFHLAATEFQKLFRLTPDLAENLVAQLDGQLRGTRITAISTEKQVLAALRFFATGCYQRPVGEEWGISMSQSSVSRSIHRVTDAINYSMFCAKVRFPMTQIERQSAKETFASSLSSFVEGTIGAIDCTHISILRPKCYEEGYVNHFGYHSINVQMICDPNLKILNVNAKYPGAHHNSYIWSSSAVRRVMERSFQNGNSNMFLIGDSEYLLEPWLMTPLAHKPKGSPQFRYNEALCKAHKPVERLFGIFKGTWRCLSQKRTLLYDPGFTGKVVNACAVLHNMGLGEQIHEPEEEEPRTDSIYISQGAPSSTAKRVQDRIIANFFT